LCRKVDPNIKNGFIVLYLSMQAARVTATLNISGAIPGHVKNKNFKVNLRAAYS